MLKYDDHEVLDVDSVENADSVSGYLKRFSNVNKMYLSSFDKMVIEYTGRILWRYSKFGFKRDSK